MEILTFFKKSFFFFFFIEIYRLSIVPFSFFRDLSTAALSTAITEEDSSGAITYLKDRPALLVSSTSWTGSIYNLLLHRLFLDHDIIFYL